MNVFERVLLRTFLANLVRAEAVLVVAGVTLGAGAWTAEGRNLAAYAGGTALRALPLALLVATLFTVGLLARRGELTALAAAGWSLPRIVRPLVLVGLGATLLTAVLDTDGPAGPATDLLAVLLGVPLAATPRRATRFGGFLTALAVFVAYAVVTATADALARHGVLPPTAAAWLPPTLFTVLAALLWRPFLSRR